MKKILTIAGSDCIGGSGVQADLKTFAAHRMYGMSVITAVAAQNTTGITKVVEMEPEFIAQQLDAVFTDIVPDAVKIGMVSNVENIKIISQKLVEYQAQNIVIDPVMMTTSGDKIISDEAIEHINALLFPISAVSTPNMFEAEQLSGMKITCKADMEQVARKLSSEFFSSVLVKGGYLKDCADDCLLDQGNIRWFTSKRIDTPNTHGTGSTLSAAIACYLANGETLEKSVDYAKRYLQGCLEAKLDLGKGKGPVNHHWKGA